MKTAIILVGNIRSWDQCKQNFKDTFEHLNPDIFVSTYNLQYGHHPFIQNRIGDFDDVVLSNEEIKEKFDGLNVKDICIEKEVDISKDIKSMHPNFKEYGSCYHQYRKFNIGIQMMNDYGNYDCVIKTRCDMIYNNFEIEDVENSITIDSGNVFPNDCILITNQSKMSEISEFICDEFFSSKYSDSHLFPPHGLLLNAIKDSGLNIIKKQIMSYVIRKGNRKEYY